MIPTHCLRIGVLLTGLAIGTTPALARSARDAPVPSHGKLGQDLFLAINRGDLPGVKSLLARGADPNARNGLEMTPLMLASASGQVPVIEALLGAGAKLDGACIFGTSLTFAVMAGSDPAAKLLLARGANPNPQRPDGITALMLAARDGKPQIVHELLSRKVDVNAKDGDGATALIYAARNGHEEAARVLVESGAAIDAADSHRWTPLMYAAVNGHAGFVKLLLAKGANVNARDGRGRAPLVLTATYGDHPAVLRALAEGGADLSATDGKKRTALTLATTRGYGESAAYLRERGAGTAPVAAIPAAAVQRTPQEAVQVSLATLQQSMRVFTKLTGCISCHQEGLGRVVTGAARERGLATDPAVSRAQLERISGALTALRPLHAKALQDPAAMKNVPLIEIGEVPPSYGFMLAGLVAHKQPANEAIAAAAQVLARQQVEDGHWPFTLHRVPMQSSFFTTTALAVQVMRAYAPKNRAAEVAERLRRAKTWLLTAPAQTSDDLAYRLLGLKWAGASLEERQKAIDALRAAQRPDGGWSQDATLQSDAYATGQALYAMHLAGGVPVTDPLYQRGAQFLLRTQEEDGSWFVAKRAIPANNYFDAHFPHGQSQYASFNATCWATLALMQQIDRPRPQQAAR